MTVLDIDLDFFVSPIFQCRQEPKGRLDPIKYSTRSVPDAMDYAASRLKLSPGAPVAGALFENHAEVFDYILEKSLVDLRFIHVDAHSDLGIGDHSMQDICTDLLHLPVLDRQHVRGQRRDLVFDSNWLVYLLALRRISTLEMVFPEEWIMKPDHQDIPRYLWRSRQPEDGCIEMPILSEEQLRESFNTNYYPSDVEFEPSVIYRRHSSKDFELSEKPDLVL